ncbi:MAG TPA: hypothetical protein VMS78_09395 [Rhizomicrobium sp.]|nr:hypothetical protein [Rhizomicrobium sp.]
MAGYSQTELDDIQAKWNFRFPPDLEEMLRERRQVIEEHASFDWINTPESQLRTMLDWPFESFLFDINHGYWWKEWGEMPAALFDRAQRLKQIFTDAPKLIPVFGHRYIPEEPYEKGNPIFSVYQMDVILYGSHLEHYILNENGLVPRNAQWPAAKKIKFWSRAVELNGEWPGN